MKILLTSGNLVEVDISADTYEQVLVLGIGVAHGPDSHLRTTAWMTRDELMCLVGLLREHLDRWDEER